MRLKLGKPTRMWAHVELDGKVACAIYPFISFHKENAVCTQLGKVERVLVTVERIPAKRGKRVDA
jgi:hypothetical protein